MSKFLVTGGAGFIGSHLCDRLLAEGSQVICVDSLITSTLKNIKHLAAKENFRFIKKNISFSLSIKGKIDSVLHFASPASPEDYLKLPIQTLEAGSLGTRNALELAKNKKAKFILASTSEVYGDPLVHPQPESYWGNVNPIGVRGCYDESKRFAEALTMAYRRVHRVDTKIIRIFNTYGPRMRILDGRVVPNFIYQALRGKPLTVYGNGLQTRSFCYIDDLIEGILRIMRSRLSLPVNLGNPVEFTILELAKIINRLTGAKARIDFKPLPEDDPRQRRPDIGLLRKMLKWEPKVKLEEGLRETISWFRLNL
jgi:dTDP-glucose 4,6-dehydratase